MQRTFGIVFLISWLLAGCTIDYALDNWSDTIIFILALATAIICAVAIGTKDK